MLARTKRLLNLSGDGAGRLCAAGSVRLHACLGSYIAEIPAQRLKAAATVAVSARYGRPYCLQYASVPALLPMQLCAIRPCLLAPPDLGSAACPCKVRCAQGT